jgi:DNA-directed RNA polymerase specialized sigma24 family protein
MKSGERPNWSQSIGTEELEAAISSLDPRLAEPIRLRRLGLSFEEIAARLKITTTHVGARIFRGQQRLREILEAQVGRLSDAAPERLQST